MKCDWMRKGEVGICYTNSHKSVHKRKKSEMEKCSAHAWMMGLDYPHQLMNRISFMCVHVLEYVTHLPTSSGSGYGSGHS